VLAKHDDEADKLLQQRVDVQRRLAIVEAPVPARVHVARPVHRL
jgi:hypothetical protein